MELSSLSSIVPGLLSSSLVFFCSINWMDFPNAESFQVSSAGLVSVGSCDFVLCFKLAAGCPSTSSKD